ncbi:43kDa postsynaptic protein [Parasponia andersonii]|uniref:RING-type E3 ubiquitin transferase n=1 Tax=Parasponia andersonii TaxID=3476 RepID=A0A2P5CSU1_PARAD|nr:43kDa postsynaptic protein [Parasponia andersonii]
MDPVIHGSLSPITSPENSLFKTPLHSSDTSSFPIIAIAIIGILATAFLLVSYYIFVIKCCLNWHRIDILRRFSLSRDRAHEEMLMVYSPGTEARGLDESVIRSIPVFHFKKHGNKPLPGKAEAVTTECAVCLGEFQDDEKLRVIPNCCHIFHIDCIDVWLQNNANCPLCRTSVSTENRHRIDQIVAPSSSPIDPSPYGGSLAGGDDDDDDNNDYVVIELSSLSNDNSTSSDDRARERLLSEQRVATPRSISPSPAKKDTAKKRRKLQKGTSMGDECIDIAREKDDQFSIQPIRRSFSMDSSADRKMFMTIQEAVVQQQGRVNMSSEVVSPIEGCSSRVRRSFFSFGHNRGSSRSAVLPVYLEP